MTRPSIWHGDESSDPPHLTPREKAAGCLLLVVALLIIALVVRLAWGGTVLLADAGPVVIREPTDSVTVPTAWPADAVGGAVLVEWTPAKDDSNTDGYRHFLTSDFVTVRSYYEHGYDDVKLGLSLRRGAWALATGAHRPVVWETVRFQPGKRHTLIWAWIVRSGPVRRLELAAWLDGRLVSWALREAPSGPGGWPCVARIGARGLRPGWPERHRTTGTIHRAVVVALTPGGKLVRP